MVAPRFYPVIPRAKRIKNVYSKPEFPVFGGGKYRNQVPLRVGWLYSGNDTREGWLRCRAEGHMLVYRARRRVYNFFYYQIIPWR